MILMDCWSGKQRWMKLFPKAGQLTKSPAERRMKYILIITDGPRSTHWGCLQNILLVMNGDVRNVYIISSEKAPHLDALRTVDVIFTQASCSNWLIQITQTIQTFKQPINALMGIHLVLIWQIWQMLKKLRDFYKGSKRVKNCKLWPAFYNV